MKEVVLKLDNVHNNDDCKQKVMHSVTSILGVDSVSINMKERSLKITGNMDPTKLVNKLKKKQYHPIIESMGPPKKPEGPKGTPPEPKETTIKPTVISTPGPSVIVATAHNGYINCPPCCKACNEDSYPSTCVIM